MLQILSVPWPFSLIWQRIYHRRPFLSIEVNRTENERINMWFDCRDTFSVFFSRSSSATWMLRNMTSGVNSWTMLCMFFMISFTSVSQVLLLNHKNLRNEREGTPPNSKKMRWKENSSGKRIFPNQVSEFFSFFDFVVKESILRMEMNKKKCRLEISYLEGVTFRGSIINLLLFASLLFLEKRCLQNSFISLFSISCMTRDMPVLRNRKHR